MNDYDYSTAADYARITGMHRSTIVDRIKAGKIKVRNRCDKIANPKKHWKICNKDMKKAKTEKPYTKHYARWSPTEDYILISNHDKSTATLSTMLKRNQNSIRIRLCRLKKQHKFLSIIRNSDLPMLNKNTIDKNMVDEYMEQLSEVQKEIAKIRKEHKDSGMSYRLPGNQRYTLLKTAEKNLIYSLDVMFK